MKKTLLLAFIVMATVSCSSRPYPQKSAWRDRNEMITPPYLREGDLVGIAAASSKCPPDSAGQANLTALLESWGLRVRFGEHVFDQDGGWFAGTDEHRAADLQRMIDDPEVKAILFYRGGYGSVRTLDLVNLRKLRRHPKWLAGYSDVTMLHYALNKVRVESLHSNMPVGFRYDSVKVDTSALRLREALFGRWKGHKVAPHPFNRKGTATGRLIGGNLSLIYAAAGTDVDNDLSEPSVLFIEDLSESMYHVDRMLQNLKRSGKFARAKAVLVGHMTSIRDTAKFGKNPYELISEYTSELNVPVIFGFPAGHSRPNDPMYFGRKVRVKVTDEGGSVEYLD